MHALLQRLDIALDANLDRDFGRILHHMGIGEDFTTGGEHDTGDGLLLRLEPVEEARQELDALVTYDTCLAAAAEREGLPVAVPGPRG